MTSVVFYRESKRSSEFDKAAYWTYGVSKERFVVRKINFNRINLRNEVLE